MKNKNKKRLTINPGKILAYDYLEDRRWESLRRFLKLTQVDFYQLLIGEKKITKELSEKLGEYFGQSPKLWYGIQKECDNRKRRLNRILDSFFKFDRKTMAPSTIK